MAADKLQFLVVEDDEDDYFLVRQLLNNSVAGAQVERASSADAALEIISERTPDICVVDYRLGQRDGLEVLRELKNRDVAAPVIFLTGQGDEEVAVEAMKAGAVDYLLKSKLTAPSLASAVRYALTLHQKEEAVQSARRALHASEQRFRALVENNSDIIATLDAAGDFLYISPSVRQVMGFAPEEVLDRPSFTYIHEDDVAAVREFFGKLLELPNTPLQMEFRVRHKNGTWRYVESTCVNRLEDPAVRAVVLNDRDITKRRVAEEALRTSELQYRTLVQLANEGIWQIDAEGRTTFVNATMPQMLGYAPEEMIGRSVLEFLGPSMAIASQESLKRQQRGPGSPGEHMETSLLRTDGSEIWVMLNSTPIYDAAGTYTGALALVTDITERRALQQQLLHSQKMDAVGQLAGGVAHDFNNLLMVISSYAELLSDSICQTNAQARHHAGEILKAARRAAGLTRQLLAFSRKQVMSPCILDLNTVVAEVERMLRRVIGEDIRMTIKPGAPLWKVKVDPVQMEQVIMNLAVNARDAMPRGGHLILETANVRLDEEYARRHVGVTPGDHVMLAVSDTGCGIAADILPHIFEPFFTTKEQGKGTGLGLPTAYGIIKQSGGCVWVYSELGKGTVFKVYLPRAQATAEPAHEDAAARPAARGSETILVVEDEEAVRAPTCEYLGLRGYTVLQGKDGADALQVLEHFQGQVELMITDVVMPGMSGADLSRRVRELRPEIRVMYVSGYTESMVVQHGIQADCGFLQKPFTLSALGNKVREVLDARLCPAEAAEAFSPADEGVRGEQQLVR